jgi:response regulator RpfG family c-di-GMP phosphodiesterase
MTAGSKRPILVVESDPESLNALCRLLQREFAVYAASSAWEALEVLCHDEIHVIIAGQRLPEMTGMELLRRVQQLRPATVRIALAAYCDLRAVIGASEEVELFRYLTKPWDGDEVRSTLRQACMQYDQAAAQQQLLGNLQSYQRECLLFLEGLRHGSFGELNLQGHLKLVELAANGEAVLDGVLETDAFGLDREADRAQRQPAPPLPSRCPTH